MKQIKTNLEGAKKIIAGMFKKEIFGEHRADFHIEYWDPFD